MIDRVCLKCRSSCLRISKRQGLLHVVRCAWWAERDDAVRGDDRALGGAELIERPRKWPHEQPEVLVLGRRVRLRRPDPDAELLGRLDIGQTSAEASARRRASAEQQPDDRAVDERPASRTRPRTSSPRPRPAAIAGGDHQLARLVVGEGACLARRRPGRPGVALPAVIADAGPAAVASRRESTRRGR